MQQVVDLLRELREHPRATIRIQSGDQQFTVRQVAVADEQHPDHPWVWPVLTIWLEPVKQ